jgi:large subunit ribosomal protein L31e
MEKEDKEEQQASEEPQAEEQTTETATQEEPAEKEAADKELEEILAEEEPAEETAEAEEETEAPAEEEEVKPSKRKRKEEEEEEFVEERIYTIPLGKAWVRPPKKRAPRAMHMVKAFITKHMKLAMRVEEEEEEEELPKLIINADVNEKIWSRGIEKPPRKIRVRAAKDKDGNVTVFLAEGE